MLILWSIILILPLFNFIQSSSTTQIVTEKPNEKDVEKKVMNNEPQDHEKKFSLGDTRFRRSSPSQDFLDLLLRNDPDCQQTNSKFAIKCRQVKLSSKYPSLSPKRMSGMRMWKSVNLSGLREGALFAEEPNYLLVRRETADVPDFDSLRDPFIPPRGRKKSNYNTMLKRNSLESSIFDNTDLFMPQRGKKSGHSKMANFDDIIPTDELFFPNRGKKTIQQALWEKRGFPLDLQDEPLFYPNRGKKSVKREAPLDPDSKSKIKKESASLANDLLSQDLFYPNRGKKRVLEVLMDTPDRREMLNNFSENHDTFYSDRGRQRFPADTLMTGDFSRASELMPISGFSNSLTNTGYTENEGDFLDYYNTMLDDNQ
ncbi:uncharacterized protein LOC132265426 [Phlebotomus argentipes]|uniref:uncharacterized protein LOC132265426 n=1 Tax=Phlebotomus argentipes TaxID=94469 RepID=UPI0028929E5C|nr:uncharacterized protein LOC132265426 [Phlebotomus argentipes]